MEITVVWLASIVGTTFIAYTHRLPVVRWLALGIFFGPAAAIAAAIAGADMQS